AARGAVAVPSDRPRPGRPARVPPAAPRPDLLDAQLLDRARARACDDDAHAPGGQRVAGFRDAAEPLEHEAAERLVLALRHVPAEPLVHLAHRSPRAHEPPPGAHPPVLPGRPTLGGLALSPTLP